MTRRARTFALAASAALCLAVTACGSDEATSTATTVSAAEATAPAGAGGSLSISGFAFGPAAAAAGATVSVNNADGATHTVSADDGSFDVTVSGGSTGEFAAPTAPGSYAFHCAIHGSMTGTLVVGG